MIVNTGTLFRAVVKRISLSASQKSAQTINSSTLIPVLASKDPNAATGRSKFAQNRFLRNVNASLIQPSVLFVTHNHVILVFSGLKRLVIASL